MMIDHESPKSPHHPVGKGAAMTKNLIGTTARTVQHLNARTIERVTDIMHILDNRRFNRVLALFKAKAWAAAIKQIEVEPFLSQSTFKMTGLYDEQEITTGVNILHVACKNNAPVEVIVAILQANNKLVSQRDSSCHRLPIHVATMNQCSFRVIRALLTPPPPPSPSSPPPTPTSSSAATTGGETESSTSQQQQQQQQRQQEQPPEYYLKTAQAQDIHGRLPIHYACADRQNGERYLRYLLKAHPKSAKIPDNRGFLPLHIACKTGMPMAMISLLLRASPESIYDETKEGKTPVQCAEDAKELGVFPGGNTGAGDIIVTTLQQVFYLTDKSRSGGGMVDIHNKKNVQEDQNENARKEDGLKKSLPPRPPCSSAPSSPPPLASISSSGSDSSISSGGSSSSMTITTTTSGEEEEETTVATTSDTTNEQTGSLRCIPAPLKQQLLHSPVVEGGGRRIDLCRHESKDMLVW